MARSSGGAGKSFAGERGSAALEHQPLSGDVGDELVTGDRQVSAGPRQDRLRGAADDERGGGDGEGIPLQRLDAIPDWRYDPLPGQTYIDVTPERKVRTVIRYIGSGHWSGALRLFPYDGSGPTIYGNGRFIQCPAVDRYHFDENGLLEEGETLYDAIDCTQRAGILPRDDSWQFKSLFAASRLTRLPGAFRGAIR